MTANVFRVIASLLLLTALPAGGAVPTVSITGKVRALDGTTVTDGSVSCRLSQAGSAPAGATVQRVAGRADGAIALDGSLTLVLVPNDVIVPTGTVYSCYFSARSTDGRPKTWTETWRLSSSSHPVKFGEVARVSSVHSASWTSDGTNLFPSAPIAGDVGSATVTATGTTFARPLDARFSDVVYAADFGVLGDNDPRSARANVASLDAAIAAAKSSSTCLILPPGIVYLDMQIEINTTTGLCMEGLETTLKATGASRRGEGTALLAIGGTGNAWRMTLRQFSVDANNLWDYAGSFGNSGANPSSSGTAFELSFTKGLVAGCQLVAAQGFSWYGCDFSHNTGDGLLVVSTSDTTHEQFYSCSFTGNGLSGIHIKRGSTFNFYAPLIDGNGSEGILIDGFGITQNIAFTQPYMELNGVIGGKRQIKVTNTADTTMEYISFIRPAIGVSSGIDVVSIGGGIGTTMVAIEQPTPRGLAGHVYNGGWLDYRISSASNAPNPAINWTVDPGGRIIVSGSSAIGTTPGFYVGVGDGTTPLVNNMLGVTVDGVSVGGTQPVKAFASDTRIWDPPSIAAGTSVSFPFTFTGFAPVAGDHLVASFSNELGAGVILTAEPIGSGQVRASITNTGGSTVNPASGTLRVSVIRF